MPRAESAAPRAERRSRTSSAVMGETLGVRVECVQAASASPARCLTALTASRSCVMCAALTFVTVAPVGSSARVTMGSSAKL